MNKEILKKKKAKQTPTWDKQLDWDNMAKDIFIKNSKPGWDYCDVGSCHGLFTYTFIDLSKPNGKVYAFELNDANPEIPNCIFERKAVSDKDGYEPMYDCGTHMSNILGHDVNYNENNFLKEVESITLDTYFKNKNLNCLKIDVEGAELKVIKGGINTIKKCNIVVIECHLDEIWPEMFDIFKANNLDFLQLYDNKPVVREKREYLIYRVAN